MIRMGGGVVLPMQKVRGFCPRRFCPEGVLSAHPLPVALNVEFLNPPPPNKKLKSKIKRGG